MRAYRLLTFAAFVVLVLGSVLPAEITVVVDRRDRHDATGDFAFRRVAVPSRSDAAQEAVFTLIDGRRDANGGGLETLHDGKVPTDEDRPRGNFFFAADTDGGRILVDLRKAITIKQVNTYSWHPAARGPQVYTFYASDGKGDGFDAQLKKGTDPRTCGWTLVVKVDTRPERGVGGGQYGVSVCDSTGNLGTYRYLLFDIERTESDDPFGNTFYCEIDVVDPTSPVVSAVVPRIQEVVETDGGAYRIIIDTTETPDLTQWVREELAPVVQQWYPRLVAMLPSEGYEAPRKVTIMFSSNMRGVAATGGSRVRCAASWFRTQLNGEAKGAIVHELVHVVQSYGRARRTNPNATRTPGWVVEGIADYVRWFLYEPHTHGAEITARNIGRARYDASYRISANFLNWVTLTYDKEIVRKLNAAAREGRYTERLWEDATGKTVEELDAEWKAAMKAKVVGAESVFEDLSFRQGFLLSYPDVSQGRAVEATLDLGRAGARPAWRLCQWATKYSLADAACVQGQQGDVSYENEGKRVLVGGPGSSNRDLILEIRGQSEYGERARQAGESWPHLLIEQDAARSYRLDSLKSLTLAIRLRLLSFTDHMAQTDYDPGLHAAQFQMFFIVKNINPQAADYGDYYWFGVPFFDNRHDSPPAYMAKDAGQSAATGKFIYTVAAQALGIRSLKGGRWVRVDADLLAHIKHGLAEAVARGYLEEGKLSDYAVVNMNLGWEMPGTFDGAMQIRDLAISATPKETSP